jgi:hypothetical protein
VHTRRRATRNAAAPRRVHVFASALSLQAFQPVDGAADTFLCYLNASYRYTYILVRIFLSTQE